MKKIFTFVFCALCAVSVWGTEYTIDDGNNGNSDQTEYAPFRSYKNFSLSQIIYLKSELPEEAKAGNITSLSFKYAGATAITRNLDIYMSNTTKTNFSAFVSVTSAQKVFSGFVTTTANNWYTITLETPFAWDGSSNILVTIDDNTEDYTNSETKHYKNSFNGLVKRLIYFSDDSKNLDPTSPSENGTVSYLIPKVKFNIEVGSTPITTPTINVSETELDFGSYYPEGEIVSQTFTVTASNLTENISLSTEAAGVTISPESIDYTNTALANDGVEVTVTLGSEYAFPINNPKVSVASGATSKSVTLKATKILDSNFSNQALNFINSNGYYIVDGNVTIQSINTTDKSMSIKAPNTTKNANYTLIDGQATFAIDGKFSGLKGKYEDEVFKIFSYTSYTAPDPSTSIEIYEDVDNHDTWPEAAQSGKSLIIKRTVVPDCWNTICLPTYLTSTQVTDIFGTGADVRSFIGANITSSSITLNFSEHPKIDGMEAGVPYLIKPTQARDNPLNLTNQSFNPTPGSVENNGIVFQGVLVPTEIDGGDGSDYIIVGANNTLFHPTGTGTISGMRAYFHVVGSAAKAALKTAKVSMNTGSTTELVLVKDNQTKPYKTMVNDQIVIVKEGQKVNIFGQTVK